MTSRTHEYAVLPLPYIAERDAKAMAWADVMNGMAAEGWRLVGISDELLKGGTMSYATFEREYQPPRKQEPPFRIR